jgi:hypothetical protein
MEWTDCAAHKRHRDRLRKIKASVAREVTDLGHWSQRRAGKRGPAFSR